MHSAGNLWKRKKNLKNLLGSGHVCSGQVSPNEELPLSKDKSPNLQSISFPAAGAGYWHLLTLAYLTWTIWTCPCPGHEVSHRHLAECNRVRQGVGKQVGFCPSGLVSYRGLGRIPCSSQRPYKVRQVPTYQPCFIAFWGLNWISGHVSNLFSYVRPRVPTWRRPTSTTHWTKRTYKFRGLPGRMWSRFKRNTH